MKHSINLKFMVLAIFAVILSFTFTSCSKDDDTLDVTGTTIVGTWVTSSSTNNGTKLKITFSKNNKGSLSILYYDNMGNETGNQTEYFEYVYNSTDHELVIIDSSLAGTWDIVVSSSKMTMENYQYLFSFNKQ